MGTSILLRCEKWVLAVSLLLFSGCVASSTNNTLAARDLQTAQDGVVLPTVQVTDLNGTDLVFPKDFSTDCNVIVFGFAHEQKDKVKAWIDPLNEKLKDLKNCSLYEIPVIEITNVEME